MAIIKVTAGIALLTLALGFAGVGPAWADARGERPIQMQVDGLGVTLGWHINELIYIGVTSQAEIESRSLRRGRFDDRDEIYNQRGVQHADESLGRRNSFELRISPWEFGFYFAFGLLRVYGDSQHVLYDERARVVGDGAYVTAIDLDVRGKPKTAGAVGFGFNHVTDFGLSLGAGILVGLDQPDPPEIDIQYTNSAGVDVVPQSDKDKFRAEVEDDFSDTPFIFHLAIGYNF